MVLPVYLLFIHLFYGYFLSIMNNSSDVWSVQSWLLIEKIQCVRVMYVKNVLSQDIAGLEKNKKFELYS